MRITVFGATGPAGRLAVHRALDQGHKVTAYARNPAKLDERPGLTVVAGELDDAAAIRPRSPARTPSSACSDPDETRPASNHWYRACRRSSTRWPRRTSAASSPRPPRRRPTPLTAATCASAPWSPASASAWPRPTAPSSRWQRSSANRPSTGPWCDCPCSTTSRATHPPARARSANRRAAALPLSTRRLPRQRSSTRNLERPGTPPRRPLTTTRRDKIGRDADPRLGEAERGSALICRRQRALRPTGSPRSARQQCTRSTTVRDVGICRARSA